MKTITLLLVAGCSLLAMASEEPTGISGVVNCSMVSPRTTGFQLIKVHKKNRGYANAVEVDNMRFEGTYWSVSNDLNLKVSALNEDGEVSEELLTLETTLGRGDYLRSKTKLADRTLEIYCQFVPTP